MISAGQGSSEPNPTNPTGFPPRCLSRATKLFSYLGYVAPSSIFFWVSLRAVAINFNPSIDIMKDRRFTRYLVDLCLENLLHIPTYLPDVLSLLLYQGNFDMDAE